MLAFPAVMFLLLIMVRRSSETGLLPKDAFKGKNGRFNAIMSIALLVAAVGMGASLYGSYELAGDDFGAFSRVDHSVLSGLMYQYTSGSFTESSLMAFGFIVVTLGILGGLMSSRSRKMAFVATGYIAISVATFVMACL